MLCEIATANAEGAYQSFTLCRENDGYSQACDGLKRVEATQILGLGMGATVSLPSSLSYLPLPDQSRCIDSERFGDQA